MDLKTPRGWRRMTLEEAKAVKDCLDQIVDDNCIVGFDKGAYDWKGNYRESVKPGEVGEKVIIRTGTPNPNYQPAWANLPKVEPKPEVILVPKPPRVIPPEEAIKYATEVKDNDHRQITTGSRFGTLQRVKMDLKTPRGWKRMTLEQAKQCKNCLDQIVDDYCIVGFDKGAYDWKGEYRESVKPGEVGEKVIIRVGQPNPNVSVFPEFIRVDAKTGKELPPEK